jgi:broad specificity phosphatase PhoE
MKTKLIIIRHGETHKNIANILHTTNDPDTLTETGKQQMQKVAEFLTKESISNIYSSKEPRAIESANAIANKMNMQSTTVSGLRERNWGDLSGKPWVEIKDMLEEMDLETRWNFLPENGESWKEFAQRLEEAMHNIVASNKGKTVAIISHGGVIRALIPILLKWPREESFKYEPHNGSVSIFESENGVFDPVTIDSVDHLN